MRASVGAVLCAAACCASAAGCLTTNPAGLSRTTGEALSVDSHTDPPRLRQGSSAIDEQDFYEIAGDAASVQMIRAHRQAIVWKQAGAQLGGYAGIGGIVVGGGALAGGIVWTVQDGPIGLVALLPGALIVTGSIIAIPVGFASAADYADMESEPLLPSGRALAAAKRYNKTLDRRR
ncbi:MAG TPA: hypothetical protein VGO62_21990 [Myxococcota bacterium]